MCNYYWLHLVTRTFDLRLQGKNLAVIFHFLTRISAQPWKDNQALRRKLTTPPFTELV